ncbi:MAG TPA: flagellar basal body L-ring protein FlgH [Candidatus Sulfotelmatobacter sp.]|jgi:flagellar L-ring protein precursor FlgH|nr:flagellar basal body L-ring protein FlgH [Candidatus Sulfotelmatobacter sp.]
MKPSIVYLTFFALLAHANAQSLWNDETSRSLVADKRACAIGDIVTIVVQENSSANKNNETKTEKSSSLTAAIKTFLYGAGAGTSALLSRGGQMPALEYSSDLKHDGSGAINNSESIVAQVAAKVIDVLPNGNLMIEGKRETAFSNEHQTIVLHGVIRTEDITSANTILSYNIADATVQITGKGTVSNATNKGWFTRIYEFVNPF